ncbi:hypothetical protein BKA81DRAFT_82265 [Phyllosticta paracitricarpa]
MDHLARERKKAWDGPFPRHAKRTFSAPSGAFGVTEQRPPRLPRWWTGARRSLLLEHGSGRWDPGRGSLDDGHSRQWQRGGLVRKTTRRKRACAGYRCQPASGRSAAKGMISIEAGREKRTTWRQTWLGTTQMTMVVVVIWC